jgi:pimeloyl-ACP methyl ester carboxylesterase
VGCLRLSPRATVDPEHRLGRGATVLVPINPAFEARIRAIPIVPNADLADPSALSVDEAAFARTFQHGRMPVNGLRIHYVIGGHGSPVLLLHGWPSTWYEWKRVMPLLARTHTVIVADLPGLGRSEGPVNGGRKRDIAETMLGLMTALGYERFDVVGHDWGTPTAFAMSYLGRGRIGKIVLTESTIPGVDVEGFADWDRFNSMWWHHEFQAELGVPELLVQGRERRYLESKYRAWTWNYENAFTKDYLDEFTNAYEQPGALAAGFSLYRALKQDAIDNRAFLDAQGRITQPVLVVTGRYQVNEALHRQVAPIAADYSGAIIDQAQHFLMIEAPATLAGLIDGFLDGRPVPQSPRSRR